MATINLCKLTKILNSVITLRDYRSPRALLECKIFNEKNDRAANCVFDDINSKSWMDLSDSNVISELTRARLDHHLSATKITYAVTKLIIYHYNGILRDIELDIANDLKELDENSLDCIVAGLVELQNKGELPLLNDLKISRDNLAKCVVACALHCFYIDGADIRKPGNEYSKATIIALSNSGVTQEEFERDFPDYVFKLSWDELIVTNDCNYSHCERCRHKCVQLKSNYNVEQLIKLYLNSNIKPKRREQPTDEIVSEEDLNMLCAMVDTLSSETKSVMIRMLVKTKMSMGEKMQYAFDLMMQDRNKDDEN